MLLALAGRDSGRGGPRMTLAFRSKATSRSDNFPTVLSSLPCRGGRAQAKRNAVGAGWLSSRYSRSPTRPRGRARSRGSPQGPGNLAGCQHRSEPSRPTLRGHRGGPFRPASNLSVSARRTRRPGRPPGHMTGSCAFRHRLVLGSPCPGRLYVVGKWQRDAYRMAPPA